MTRVIKIAASIVYFAVAALIALLTGRRQPRLVVLYYHAVPARLSERFVRQLDAVKKCARVVPADYQEAGEGNRRLVAITFDDAFQSVVDVALPELAMRGMHATIFVPSGALGRSPEWEMEGSAEDRSEIIATCETLNLVASPLVSIGAHTVSHPHLTRLGCEAARAEITRSKADLEGMLGTPVQLFAFPYGDYDAQTVKLCREAGYKYAFTIVPELINIRSDEFLRGRVAVTPADGALEFWLKIHGAYAWMRNASALKRALLHRHYDSARSNSRHVA